MIKNCNAILIGLKVKERGFMLVEMDTELWSEEPTPSASRHGSQDGEITDITKESWEVCTEKKLILLLSYKII